jgi:hypothetical protein
VTARTLRAGAILGVLAWAAMPSLAQDGIELTPSYDRDTGSMTLEWTGGQPPWRVFRSPVAASALDPANKLGEIDASPWIDFPPPAEILFYLVNACGVPAPPQPHGCSTCSCCDSWGVSWSPVECATHYVVRWRCGIGAEQVWNVGSVTSIEDVCIDLDMCNSCVSAVSYIRVQACNAAGCSNAADVPVSERPSACGGGCCC